MTRTRHPNMFGIAFGVMALTFSTLTTVGAVAAPVTSSFTITGAVDRPGTYSSADLQALPNQTTSVTYQTSQGPVSASFTGPTLWSTLTSAGLTPVPGARNSSLRNVIVATGSDGYAVAFSGGELDPRFGGAARPDLVAYARDGQPLSSDGFARVVVPGDVAGGRYVSNLANLDVVQAPTNPSLGGGTSGSFTLSGLVSRPGVYDAATLLALPSITQSVTYTSGGTPVSASFTGVSLWSLLNSVGLLGDARSLLTQYVLATGSDGYEAAFSLGELNPRFGGGGSLIDLVAFAQDGAPLGSSGFARLVVPGDVAGGRYVSNLVSLQVLNAAPVVAVPEPGSLALLLTGLTALVAARRRGKLMVEREIG